MAPILRIPEETTSSIIHTYNNTPAANRVAIAARSIRDLGRRHPTAAKAVIVVTLFIVISILILVFAKAMRRSFRDSPGSPTMPSGHVYGRNEFAHAHAHAYALSQLPRQSSSCERPHHRHLENRPLNSGDVSRGQSTASVTRPAPVVTRAPEVRDEIETPPPPPYPAPPKYQK